MSSLNALIAAADPSQSINPIFAEAKEVIWGGIAFLIILVLMIKLALPPAKKAMAARTARIQSELDAGEAARSNAQTEAQQIRTALGDIGSERARLLAEADTEAAALLVEGRARLEQDVADLMAKARIDLQTASGRVNEELQSEIARASAEAIERAVTESIDYNTHRRLIDDFIAKVGAAS
jgi:F-type H+-transporting ATPase subunit b